MIPLKRMIRDRAPENRSGPDSVEPLPSREKRSNSKGGATGFAHNSQRHFSPVAEIGKITGPRELALAAEQDVDLGAVDQALAVIAAGQTFQRLTAAVAEYLAKLDPDGPD